MVPRLRQTTHQNTRQVQQKVYDAYAMTDEQCLSRTSCTEYRGQSIPTELMLPSALQWDAQGDARCSDAGAKDYFGCSVDQVVCPYKGWTGDVQELKSAVKDGKAKCVPHASMRRRACGTSEEGGVAVEPCWDTVARAASKSATDHEQAMIFFQNDVVATGIQTCADTAEHGSSCAYSDWQDDGHEEDSVSKVSMVYTRRYNEAESTVELVAAADSASEGTGGGGVADESAAPGPAAGGGQKNLAAVVQYCGEPPSKFVQWFCSTRDGQFLSDSPKCYKFANDLESCVQNCGDMPGVDKHVVAQKFPGMIQAFGNCVTTESIGKSVTGTAEGHPFLQRPPRVFRGIKVQPNQNTQTQATAPSRAATAT